MKLQAICYLAAVLLSAGCSQTLGDFTILSTKNVDLSALSKSHRAGETQGEDKTYIIIFIPTGVPNLKTAIDRAIEAVPGCYALSDARLTASSFYIPYVYGENSFSVKGTALVNHAQAAHFPTRHLMVSYDKQQDRYIAKGVSKQEFDALAKNLSNKQALPASAIQ